MSEFRTLHIDELVFDEDNPRLPTSIRGGTEDQILTYLATKTRIENLMSSIGENDFFSGEAIVVTPSDGKYVVLEGNRRLAALKLLNDPDLVKRVRIKRAAEEADYKPTIVPSYIVDTRDETLQYLGFRHISGVQRWDPLAKARYLETLFERTEGEPSQRYAAVAREIGSNSPAVRRNLDALAAYRIVEDNDFYDIPGVEEETFRFGTFYTAIGNSQIAEFVGVRSSQQIIHPIIEPHVINRSHLHELVKWMFEKDSRGSTKLVESRNITKLGKVLKNEESLTALRQGQTLETAYRMTPHGRDDFIRHMNQAIEELKQANAHLYAVDKDDQLAKDVVKEASQIIRLASEWLG